MADADQAIVDQAIEYIRTLLPEALEGIQGSTDDEISDVESSLGIQFSGIHRAFLRRFGNSVGGMDFGPTDPTLSALREKLEETAGQQPPGYELFAVSRGEPGLDAVMIHSGTNTPPVIGLVYVPPDFSRLDLKQVEVASGTLSELLCYMPYVKAKYDPKPLKFMLANRMPVQGAMERFDSVARDNGLATVWFSSSLIRIVEFGDTVLIGRQLAGSPLGVSIGSSSRIEFAAAHWWLTHDVGLEFGA